MCVTRIRSTTNAFIGLVNKPEGNNTLDRPRRRGRITLKWILNRM
jgi:hypothetical protein